MARRGALLAAVLALGSGVPAAAQERAAPARLVDTVTLDPARPGATFGGISGIDYDPARRRWLLLSDDRSEKAPARFYTMRIERSGGRWRIGKPKSTALRDASGARFPKAGTGHEAVDPEAIRVAPDGSRVWSSEGDAKDGFGPALHQIDHKGRTRATPVLPANLRFDPTGIRGTRDNGTLEGLTFTPDGALWLAMEMPLIEDGRPADDDQAAPVRFTRLRDGAPAQQFAYQPDTVPAAARGRKGDNGVTEILAIDDRRMLVLERSGARDADGVYRFHCRLYLADFTAATEVAAIERLEGAGATVAAKHLLFDFDTLPDNPGNLEAMAWWPSPDGARDYVLIANDNNFVTGEPTRLLLLALPPEARGG